MSPARRPGARSQRPGAGSQPLRIGSRGSALALWQANLVAELLRRQPDAPAVEVVRIRTTGDARGDVPLWQVEGRAFFTREIDRAVSEGEVDIAVHSLKDLPTALDAGLELAAVLEREDPRDALLARSVSRLEELAAGARVGTSSLRRRAFLARVRGDLEPVELRGNVPTRIERLAQGKLDAIILAAAGLKRLGLEAHITAYLPIETFMPAVAQGAIGVVSRAGDAKISRWVRPLDHAATRLAALAERALLARVEGGCQVPLGALAQIEGNRLRLRATVCALDGVTAISASGDCRLAGRGESAGEPPGAAAAAEATAAEATAAEAAASAAANEERAASLGRQVGGALLERGATRIIEQQRGAAAAPSAAEVQRT